MIVQYIAVYKVIGAFIIQGVEVGRVTPCASLHARHSMRAARMRQGE